MSSIAIEAQGLSKHFNGDYAVSQLDLSIPKGTIYGFLGPNGCGKSTTIRMLTGLLTPSAGTVQVLGYQLPEQADALRLKIGYMTQKFSLYDNLSVLENLDFVGQIYGLSRSARKARVMALIELYHLKDKAKVRAGALSGGQKQRLALAAATIHQPQLLFLDEPTSAVDPENRREFWERLFDLSDQGTTILVSTHYMDEAERCHALAILEQGQKRADGTPKQLIAQMHAEVFEVSGDHLRQLRQNLMAEKAVVSTAQIGERLRVLVSLEQPQPEAWLKAQVSTDYQVVPARPSLEDVFVVNTGTAYAQRHPL